MFLAHCLLLAPSQSSDIPPELEPLQGNWVVVKEIRNGRTVPADLLSKVTVTIVGKIVTASPAIFEQMGTDKSSSQFVLDSKWITPVEITVDPSKNPAVIEFKTTKGPPVKMLGIYKLDGDKLSWAYAKKRPTTFESKTGSDVYYREMTRKKSEK